MSRCARLGALRDRDADLAVIGGPSSLPFGTVGLLIEHGLPEELSPLVDIVTFAASGVGDGGGQRIRSGPTARAVQGDADVVSEAFSPGLLRCRPARPRVRSSIRPTRQDRRSHQWRSGQGRVFRVHLPVSRSPREVRSRG